jgi:hypothetical protein
VAPALYDGDGGRVRAAVPPPQGAAADELEAHSGRVLTVIPYALREKLRCERFAGAVVALSIVGVLTRGFNSFTFQLNMCWNLVLGLAYWAQCRCRWCTERWRWSSVSAPSRPRC